MNQTKFTSGEILIEGWFPPREPGLLPSVKATWDGRMIQLFANDLEQAEIDLRLLSKAPEMFEALNMLLVEYKSLIPLIGQTPQEVAIVGHVESLLNSIQDGGGK